MMSELKRKGDLEINENPRFQQRASTVQRIGWVVMALLVLAALLGLFGGLGLLAKATAGNEGSAFSIKKYERFTRLGGGRRCRYSWSRGLRRGERHASGWIATTWRAFRFRR